MRRRIPSYEEVSCDRCGNTIWRSASSEAPLAGLDEGALYTALRGEITVVPKSVATVVDSVVRACRVDREEVVAAMWDLVEDDHLIYDAAAKIRRRA